MNDYVTISISLDVAKWLYQYCQNNVDDDRLMQLVKIFNNPTLESYAQTGKLYCLELMSALAPVLGL